MQPRQDPTPKPGFYVLKTDGGITAEQGKPRVRQQSESCLMTISTVM